MHTHLVVLLFGKGVVNERVARACAAFLGRSQSFCDQERMLVDCFSWNGRDGLNGLYNVESPVVDIVVYLARSFADVDNALDGGGKSDLLVFGNVLVEVL